MQNLTHSHKPKGMAFLRLVLLAPAALTAFGCSDYTLTRKGDGSSPGETGDPDDPGREDPPEDRGDGCYEMNVTMLGFDGAYDGWTDDDVCGFYSNPPFLEFPEGNWFLKSYEIKSSVKESWQQAALPEATYAVRLGFKVGDLGEFPGSAEDLVGIDLFATDSDDRTGFWTVEASRADGTLGTGVDELDDCAPCAFWPFIAINDPVAGNYTEGDPSGDLSTTQDCVKYQAVEWCPEWEDVDFEPEATEEEEVADTGEPDADTTSGGHESDLGDGKAGPASGLKPLPRTLALTSDRKSDSDARGGDRHSGAERKSRCEPGHGTFQLVPISLSGADDLSTRRLRPFQLSGDGILADDATIRSFNLPYGADSVRLRRSGPVESASKQTLSDWLPVSTAEPLLAAGIRFDELYLMDAGTVRSAGGFSAEIAWSCDTATVPSKGASPLVGGSVQPSGGAEAGELIYSFKLSEVGCPVSWPQRLTLRPRVRENETLSTLQGPPGLAVLQHDGFSVSGPPRGSFVQVGLFGLRRDWRSFPATLSAGGDALDFRAEDAGLVVVGTVLNFDASGALLKTSEVSWNGIPLCETGVYFVPVDR